MTDATKNPENVVQRRRASDWQAPACNPWTKQEHDAATDEADALGLKLHNAAKILQLAAFAAQTRQTLTAINDALVYRHDERKMLDRVVCGMQAWRDIEDPSAHVISNAAEEVQDAQDKLTTLVYKLAHRLRDGEQSASGKPQAQGRAA